VSAIISSMRMTRVGAGRHAIDAKVRHKSVAQLLERRSHGRARRVIRFAHGDQRAQVAVCGEVREGDAEARVRHLARGARGQRKAAQALASGRESVHQGVCLAGDGLRQARLARGEVAVEAGLPNARRGGDAPVVACS
jgi:hypothetical protein